MTDTGLRQRLLAVLVADAAGYSRLMAADERATVAALESARSVFREHIAAHRGRVIDMAGDSVLAVFETAAGAVSAALAVQHEIGAAHAAMDADEGLDDGVDDTRRMRFRIGVHLGDIFEKTDGTVYGDGVNIAARLQALAEAGGITVSDAVQGAVRGRVAASFVDRGPQQVKNMSHPVRAFAVHAPGHAPVHAPAHAPGQAPEHAIDEPPAAKVDAIPEMSSQPSLAVLPFANLSGDPEQDYFADGMVEDIITALARMGMMFVIARNSSFVYKGRAVDIRQVGRELGVRYVLEGSVRRSGNRLRITGQLVEAATAHHVWADRFEGTLDDVFDLQDRIADSIVSAIEPNMRRAEIERVRTRPTGSLQAYDLMLRALPCMVPGPNAKAALDEGMAFLRLALEKDPRFAHARALAAFACAMRVGLGFGAAEDVVAGLRYADEALAELRDNPMALSLAGVSLGWLGYRANGVTVMGFRYEEASDAVERALAIAPNLLLVRTCAAQVSLITGEGDAAIGHFERAMRVSPLDPGMSSYLAMSAVAHMMCGRHDRALELARQSLRMNATFVLGHRALVMALGFLGRAEESKVAARRLLEVAPDFTVSRYLAMSPYKDADFRERTASVYRAAGVPA